VPIAMLVSMFLRDLGVATTFKDVSRTKPIAKLHANADNRPRA
jgi:hypothetical protein